MLGIDVIIAFSALIFSLCFIPAPDITQVVLQSSLQGKRSGIIMVLGICSALVLNSAAVILGLAAIIQTSELAFFIMQWVGVAYNCAARHAASRTELRTCACVPLRGKVPALSTVAAVNFRNAQCVARYVYRCCVPNHAPSIRLACA